MTSAQSAGLPSARLYSRQDKVSNGKLLKLFLHIGSFSFLSAVRVAVVGFLRFVFFRGGGSASEIAKFWEARACAWFPEVGTTAFNSGNESITCFARSQVCSQSSIMVDTVLARTTNFSGSSLTTIVKLLVAHRPPRVFCLDCALLFVSKATKPTVVLFLEYRGFR